MYLRRVLYGKTDLTHQFYTARARGTSEILIICHLLSNLFPLHEIFYKISVLIVPITKGTYHVLSK